MEKKKSSSAISGRPTMNDVARVANVSPVSVSRVINDHPSIKETTKVKVKKAMRELGYFPNAAAQAMRTNVTNTIGVIITDIANSANGKILQGAEEVCSKAGKMMIATTSGFDVEGEINLIEHMQRRRVDGIILQTGHEENIELHQQIKNCTVPIVVLDRDLPFEIDSVVNEHYLAAREAVKLLISLGHKEIAIIAAEMSTRPGHDRVQGYKDELIGSGIELNESLIRAGSHLKDHAYQETISLMSRINPPTAIFAGGNQLYMGTISALKTLNLSIPDDVSLIGADEAEFSALFSPAITIVNRDMVSLGKKAAELLLARINNKIPDAARKVVLPSEVILRSSCASPKK